MSILALSKSEQANSSITIAINNIDLRQLTIDLTEGYFNIDVISSARDLLSTDEKQPRIDVMLVDYEFLRELEELLDASSKRGETITRSYVDSLVLMKRQDEIIDQDEIVNLGDVLKKFGVNDVITIDNFPEVSIKRITRLLRRARLTEKWLKHPAKINSEAAIIPIIVLDDLPEARKFHNKALGDLQVSLLDGSTLGSEVHVCSREFVAIERIAKQADGCLFVINLNYCIGNPIEIVQRVRWASSHSLQILALSEPGSGTWTDRARTILADDLIVGTYYEAIYRVRAASLLSEARIRAQLRVALDEQHILEPAAAALRRKSRARVTNAPSNAEGAVIVFSHDRVDALDRLGEMEIACTYDLLIDPIAEKVRNLIRSDDQFLRLSPNEFAVVLYHSDHEQSLYAAKRITQLLLSKGILMQGGALYKADDVRFGISNHSHGEDIGRAIRRADQDRNTVRRKLSRISVDQTAFPIHGE